MSGRVATIVPMNHCKELPGSRPLVAALLAVSWGAAVSAQTIVPTGSTRSARWLTGTCPTAGSRRIRHRRPSQRSVGASPRVHEERIQGRLATAQVSVGGRSYLIVDPAAGRYDRQADNSGRRVTPVLGELFRFSPSFLHDGNHP